MPHKCSMWVFYFQNCIILKFCIAGFDQPHHMIYLMWYSLLLFFWKFLSIIPVLAWFQNSTQVKECTPSFLSLVSSANILPAYFVYWLKIKCPIFYFLVQDGKSLNLIYLKISKIGQNFFLKVFLLNPPAWLLNHCPDLSIHNTVRLDFAEIKNQQTHTVEKVPDLTEKWKYPKFRAKFYFSLLICFKHNASLQPVIIHYSSAFYSVHLFIVFCFWYIRILSDILLSFPAFGVLYSHGSL